MTDERLTDAAPESKVTTFPEPERLVLHMPVDIRNMSLVVLAGLALLFVLHWAKAVFIPIMLSVLFSYAFSPVVNWLEAKRVPRWLGAAVLLMGMLGVIGSTTYALSNNAAQLLESLPVAVQKFRSVTKIKTGQPDSTLESVQKAATQIEQAT